MAYFDFNSTNSTITVNISNMITENYLIYKRITFYIDRNLDRQYEQDDQITAYCSDGTYQYTYTGLQQGTEYLIGIYIEYMSGGNWIPQQQYNTQYSTSGGGSSDNPIFTAEVYNDNNIWVEVTDLIYYDRVYFYLWNGGDHSNPIDSWDGASLYHSFDSLSSGFYDISVEYRYNGSYNSIYTSSGNQYFSLYISGGGSTSWSYPTTDYMQNIAGNTSKAYSVNQYEGVKIFISFAEAGTASFYVLGQTNCEIYFTDDTSFDPDTGVPINSGGAYYGGGSQITNISVEGSPRYYLIWIKGVNEQVSGGVTLGINFDGQAPISEDYVYIFNGSLWKKAISYIFNGSQWKQVIIYVYTGTNWKKITE